MHIRTYQEQDSSMLYNNWSLGFPVALSFFFCKPLRWTFGSAHYRRNLASFGSCETIPKNINSLSYSMISDQQGEDSSGIYQPSLQVWTSLYFSTTAEVARLTLLTCPGLHHPLYVPQILMMAIQFWSYQNGGFDGFCSSQCLLLCQLWYSLTIDLALTLSPVSLELLTSIKLYIHW